MKHLQAAAAIMRTSPLWGIPNQAGFKLTLVAEEGGEFFLAHAVVENRDGCHACFCARNGSHIPLKNYVGWVSGHVSKI